MTTARRGRVAWAPALLLVLAGAHAAAQPAADPSTDADVFARVFHTDPKKPQHVVVPLLVDGASAGQVLVELGRPGTPLLLEARPLLAALASRLRPEARRALEAALAHAPRTTDEALRALGLEVTYDPRRLELRLAIPPAARAEEVHALAGSRAPADAAQAIRPSTTSGYVNMRAGGGIDWPGSGAPVVSPFYAAFDGAGNVAGWVLEAHANLLEDAPATRGDVLLSHDLPDRALRLYAGDMATPLTGFQPAVRIAGLGVAKSFALQPYSVVQPVGEATFLLDRPSTVTVFVNGVAIAKLNLAAGRHDLRDLPLGGGTNQVELLIRDDRGAERRISLASIAAANLLAPGLQQFAYGVGCPLTADAGPRVYDCTHPILSLQHRIGLTTSVTAGVHLDADPDRQLAGAQAVWATRWGNFALDLDASRDASDGTGYAAGLRYDLLRPGVRSGMQSLSLIARHESPGFQAVGPPPTVPDAGDTLALLTSHELWGTTLGASLRAELRRAGVPDGVSATVTAARAIGRDMSVDLSCEVRRGGIEQDGADLFVNLRWLLPRQHQTLRASVRTSAESGTQNELAWSYQSARPADRVAAAVNVEEGAAGDGVGGSLDYSGYHFTTALSESTMLGHDGISTEHGVKAEVATALVFAGGRVAWSQPVTGSFAIVAADDLDGTVAVNPTPSGHTAEADALGPAVLPNLQPYLVTSVALDAEATLAATTFRVLPGYKSGTLLHARRDRTMVVRGTLVGNDGQPVPLAVGEVVARDGGAGAVLLTNRAGRFSLEGLSPGVHDLRLSGSEASIELVVPSTCGAVCSIGVLRTP